MSKRTIVAVSLWGALLLCAPAVVRAEGLFLQSKKVVVSGSADVVGNDLAAAREMALRRAQRAAVEEVIGVLIESSFTAEQKEIVKNNESRFSAEVAERIRTESAGYVEKQTVLTERREGNTYHVSVEVWVKERSLKEELDVLDAILRGAGYPSVLLAIAETYTNQQGKEEWIAKPSATVGIEEVLLARKIALMTRAELEAMRSDAERFRALLGNDAAAAELAAKYGADVAIIGSSRVRHSAFNELGQNMHYASALVIVRAVRGATGKVLANIEAEGRGVGVTEEQARVDAVRRVAPRVAGKLLDALVMVWSTEAQRRGETYSVSLSNVPPAPQVAKGLLKDLAKLDGVTKVERQGGGKRKLGLRVSFLGNAAQLSQRLQDAVRGKPRLAKLGIEVTPLAAPEPRRLVIEQPAPATPAAAGQVDASQLTVQRTSTEEQTGAALASVQGGDAAGSAVPAARPPESSADEPLRLQVTDSGVASATAALADAMVERYRALGKAESFHRIAVPYFEEVGTSAKEQKLGRVVAELLAVELGQRAPFVVVERERLGQVMREHRLAGLGIVDSDTAAQFGRVLGAQSLASGTIAEAGAELLVTVRQVDVESGRTVVSAQVPIDRAGLVALSSDMVVKRSKMGAVFRSMLIPGFGQLYNEAPVKSALFFGAGLATVGGGLGYYLASQSASADYHKNVPGTVGQREVANDRIRTANALLLGYGVVWALGVLDAYLSGRDFTDVRVDAAPGSSAAVHF